MNLRQLIAVEQTDESIFIFARPFILAFLPWLLLGFGLVAVGLAFLIFVVVVFPNLLMTNFQFDVFVVIISSYFLLVLPFFTVGFIDYYYDLFVVTDRRLLDVEQNSLFSRSVSELALEDIEDVNASTNGILRTFFDFGDVTVQSAGTKEQFVFEGILHPREITEIVLDLADQAKLRIEHGLGFDHLVPSGPIKGVIENKVYHSVEPLYELGAMVPHTATAHGDVALPPNPVAQSGATVLTSQPAVLSSTSSQSSVTPSSPQPSTVPTPAPNDDLDIVIDHPDQA